ncbi:MAG: hypothetical protein FJ147_07605 [Deltaproteobacteria bacterium]|nr:hypothetical protein [Deltaproteobacteria bacterium]
MSAIALTLLILWILSLWLLLTKRQALRQIVLSRSLVHLGIISGAILFLVLSLTALVFLRLLIVD